MKRYIPLVVLCICTLLACEDDFDELADTTQRHIVLTFNTDHLFDNVLYSDGTYHLGGTASLGADYRLRITTYCYDQQDSLLYSETLLADNLAPTQQVKMRHLQQGTSYRFAFVADVVKHDPYVDYYETWFQMRTKSWPDFYIYSDYRPDDATRCVMGAATAEMTPDNQAVTIEFTPITYNGYCIFNNLDNVDRLSGYAAYCSTFSLKSRAWTERNSLAYEFDYRNPQQASVVMPVSLSCADSIVTVKLRTVTLQGTDSTIINIPNKNRQSFVATFDCATLQLDNCKFY